MQKQSIPTKPLIEILSTLCNVIFLKNDRTNSSSLIIVSYIKSTKANNSIIFFLFHKKSEKQPCIDKRGSQTQPQDKNFTAERNKKQKKDTTGGLAYHILSS